MDIMIPKRKPARRRYHQTREGKEPPGRDKRPGRTECRALPKVRFPIHVSLR